MQPFPFRADSQCLIDAALFADVVLPHTNISTIDSMRIFCD
jgi:hypothetical protein